MGDSQKYAQDAHRKDMTFRQAEGIDPLPKKLAYGELNDELRRGIWNALYMAFEGERYGNGRYTERASTVVFDILTVVLRKPLDEARREMVDFRAFMIDLKLRVLRGDWATALEICQVAMRACAGTGRFGSELENAFNSPWSPYMLVDMDPYTIIPRGDEIEREGVRDNWETIKASPFEGAKSHLRQSAEAINAGDSAGAIREAIHAVESVVKVITGKPSADLAAGLKELGKTMDLHPALRDGFIKLYGYTSDEKGVRHARIDADNANVGQDEALFMFSACTAFVAYLTRKSPEKA